mgnify:CR=1 FL=1
MVTSLTQISSLLTETLNLRRQPIGLTFTNEPPENIPILDEIVPSACAMWPLAETSLFFAPSSSHYYCPLGAMVMGFDLPDKEMALLQDELGMMCGINYVREEELPHVPKIAQSTAGIIYGPLNQFSSYPDLLLLWLSPKQSMIMSESCGSVNWSDTPQGLFGRPGCASLAYAVTEQELGQSLGCVGMRINTGIADDLMLMAVPKKAIESLGEVLPALSKVHQHMETHYLKRIEHISNRQG